MNKSIIGNHEHDKLLRALFKKKFYPFNLFKKELKADFYDFCWNCPWFKYGGEIYNDCKCKENKNGICEKLHCPILSGIPKDGYVLAQLSSKYRTYLQ